MEAVQYVSSLLTYVGIDLMYSICVVVMLLKVVVGW